MSASPAPAETPPANPAATPAPAPATPAPAPGAEGATGEAAKPAEPAVEGNGSLLPPAEGDKPAEPAKPEEPKALAAPLDLTKLTLPEGLKADDPGLAKLVETLGNEKLSPQERVEALAAQHHAVLADVAKAAADGVAANYKSVNDGWIKEVAADPVIGGQRQAEALGAIAKAIDTWSPDPKATREALGLTGAGNNPAVLRTFHAFAMALAEGGPAQGAVPQGRKTAAEIMYGSSAASNQ